jgi:hypothetical protein
MRQTECTENTGSTHVPFVLLNTLAYISPTSWATNSSMMQVASAAGRQLRLDWPLTLEGI